MVQGIDVARDLPNVIAECAWPCFDLVYKKLIQRRLGAFDLGGENCFLADEGVEQQVHIGHRRRGTIEPSERMHGAIQGGLSAFRQGKRLIRRQRRRYKGAHGLAQSRVSIRFRTDSASWRPWPRVTGFISRPLLFKYNILHL